jgi:hypothetical protein
VKLWTPAFHFSWKNGYKSPNAVSELSMLSKREKKVPPPGPVNASDPASDEELLP